EPLCGVLARVRGNPGDLALKIRDRAVEVSCPDAELGALREEVRRLAGHGAERVHELDAPPGRGVTVALEDRSLEDGSSPPLGDRSFEEPPDLAGWSLLGPGEERAQDGQIRG